MTRLETGRVPFAERLGIGIPGITERSKPIHYALTPWGSSATPGLEGAPGE
jgi:hypothetical protein